MAVGQQLRVQLSKIARRRYRDPVVAAEVAHFAFHPALLVAFAGRAEIGLILPVRTEGYEAGRQLPLIAAQYLLYRARQVVVAKPTENAAEVMERQLVGFQKRLLRGPQVGAMIGRSAGHRTKRKHLQLDTLAIQVGIGFIPINLGFDTPVVALRHKGLAPGQPQRFFALRHILPHRALGSMWRSAQKRWGTYCRTVRSAAVHPGTSCRMRSHIRFAVWRCLRGALRSASRIASMNSAAGAIFTCGHSVFFRRAGIALRIASRTNRRCTRSFRDTPWIVPTQIGRAHV